MQTVSKYSAWQGKEDIQVFMRERPQPDDGMKEKEKEEETKKTKTESGNEEEEEEEEEEPEPQLRRFDPAKTICFLSSDRISSSYEELVKEIISSSSKMGRLSGEESTALEHKLLDKAE